MGQAGEGLRHRHPAHDDEARADGEDLDEELTVGELEDGRKAPQRRCSGRRDDAGGRRVIGRAGAGGVSQHPLDPAVIVDDERLAHGRRESSLHTVRLGVRWRAGQRGDHGPAVGAVGRGILRHCAGRSQISTGTVGWTRTSIVPPHARPTSQACSSVTPKRTSRWEPESRASSR